MRICVLTKRYYTEKDLITDRYGRLYHLPKQWAAQGAEVDVIALDYRSKEPAVYQEQGFQLRSVPSRFFGLSAVNAAITGRTYDMIVVSGHLNIGHTALILGKRLKVPVIFDIYDFYPAFHRMVRPLLTAYFRWLLPRFDGAIVVSRKLKSWCGRYQKSICRVPNGVDRNLFAPCSIFVARKQMDYFPKGPVLGLFGSLNTNLGAIEVEKAFREFRHTDANAELLVAGRGGQTLAECAGVRYLGHLAQDELVKWISCCDLLLIPYRHNLEKNFSQSARLAEYLSLERPIVTTRVGDAQTWFPKNYAGFCEPQDVQSLKSAVERQLKQKEQIPFPEQLYWTSLGRKSYSYLKQFCA